MIDQDQWHDYVDLLAGGYEQTRVERDDWWDENVVDRQSAIFALVSLLSFVGRMVDRLAPDDVVVSIDPGTPADKAMVRRLLNAQRTGDVDMRRALLNVVLEAGHGEHGTRGVRFATGVRNSLDHMACKGMEFLGWHVR